MDEGRLREVYAVAYPRLVGLGVYSPGLRSWARMPSLYGDIADGYVKPDGELVTCGIGQGGVRASGAGIRGASPAIPGTTCVMAGHGDVVPVVGLGDDPDGDIPMTGLLLREGQTWSLPRLTRVLDGVSSVAVTPSGTTIITNTSSGDSLVIGSDIDRIGPEEKVGQAFVAGDRLYVTSYGLMNGPIYYSEDDGHTWDETVLPGNED